MPTETGLLVLADIGGYTRFMKLHRISLAHAEETTGRLLEAVVDAVPDLELVEIEGDAAFLYTRENHGVSNAVESAAAMYRSFHSEQARLASRNRCPCDACHQLGGLTVKFVAHVGEVATQTIRDRTKLVGLDVILVHRMLKASVPVPEYVLMTEAMYEQADPALRKQAREIEEELEGIGSSRLYFLAVEDLGAERPAPPPAASALAKLGETTGIVLRGLPRMLSRRA
jgi:hypothetical protein